jgi:hypothetical protein
MKKILFLIILCLSAGFAAGQTAPFPIENAQIYGGTVSNIIVTNSVVSGGTISNTTLQNVVITNIGGAPGNSALLDAPQLFISNNQFGASVFINNAILTNTTFVNPPAFSSANFENAWVTNLTMVLPATANSNLTVQGLFYVTGPSYFTNNMTVLTNMVVGNGLDADQLLIVWNQNHATNATLTYEENEWGLGEAGGFKWTGPGGEQAAYAFKSPDSNTILMVYSGKTNTWSSMWLGYNTNDTTNLSARLMTVTFSNLGNGKIDQRMAYRHSTNAPNVWMRTTVHEASNYVESVYFDQGFAIPSTNAPPDAVSNRFAVIDNELYLYDPVRQKWLTVTEDILPFHWIANQQNIYMAYSHGDLQGPDGPVFFRPLTIVAAVITNNGATANKIYELRTNGVKFMQFQMVGSLYTNYSMNVDLPTNCVYSMFISNANPAGNIANTIVKFYTKRRK